MKDNDKEIEFAQFLYQKGYLPGPNIWECGKKFLIYKKTTAVKLLDVFCIVQIMHVGKSLA